VSIFWPVFENLIMPVIAGVTYFLLAKYIAYIAPLRKLVTGDITYKGAYWGFIFFGIFLLTRPLQISLGPHPAPLIVNNIREFVMIGLFTPAVFVGMTSFALGFEKIKKRTVVFVFALGIALAIYFAVVNFRAIGGSLEIFRIGGYSFYDGKWFHPTNQDSRLMPILFFIRVIDPVCVMILLGIFCFWRSIVFPRNSVYDNMPKKLVFQGLAVVSFGLSMLFTGFMAIIWKIPNQWWIYYLGAILAGIFEAIALSFPLHKEQKI
jgi:hypothetical protein